MTETAFRVFPDAGVVALFDEAPGGGDPRDITSLRNRPALDPENWLPNVYLHSALDNMEVEISDVMTINHAAFGAAVSDPSAEFGTASVNRYDTDPTQVAFDLVEHGLGYDPIALVALGEDILTPGYPVQLPGTYNGAGRYCCPFVTTSKVRLHEYRSRGDAGLGAISLDYRAIVIREARTPSGDKLLEFDPATGILSLALDRFNSGRRYLQVVPGGSPFGITFGRTMDARRGAPRFGTADGTVFDPIPDTTTFRFTNGNPPTSDPYSYNGSFVADGFPVQAP